MRYIDQSDKHQGSVNHNLPRSFLTGQDLQFQSADEHQDIDLPNRIPQNAVSQDHYPS